MAVGNISKQQFGGAFDTLIAAKATIDVANLADAAGATSTITVPGAALGDFVIGSTELDRQGITVTFYVSAADTVSVRFQNESGGIVDLASQTVSVLVLKRGAIFDGLI